MRPARIYELWLSTGLPDPTCLAKETPKSLYIVLGVPEGSLHPGAPSHHPSQRTAGCAQLECTHSAITGIAPFPCSHPACRHGQGQGWAGTVSFLTHWASTVQEQPLLLKGIYPKKGKCFRI